MATDIGQSFLPTFRGRPPHMSAQDFNIWQRWIPFHFQDFTNFYFDAAVGDGAIPPPGGTDKMRAAWTRITQKRIDAIGIRKDAAWILEVRASAGSSALGALLTYDYLLKLNNPFSLPIRLALITDHSDDDFRKVLRAYNVQIFEV